MVKGGQYMKIWKYEEDKYHRFYIYYENKNNILNIIGNKVLVSNAKNNDNSLFEFIEFNFN